MKSFLIALCVCMGLSGYADGDTLARTNWFDSSGLMTATPGHLSMPLTNNAQFWTTYFAPTNAPITLAQAGNQIKVTWAFTPSGVNTFGTGSPLALGLVNTPDTNRLTTDAPPSDGPYAGYATFFGAGYSGLFWNLYSASRSDPANSQPLFTGGWWGWPPGGPSWNTQAGGYSAGGGDQVPEIFVMTLTRTAAGELGVNTMVTAASNILVQVSFVDPSPNTFNFNTVSLFNDGTVSGSFDTTQFTVEFFTKSPPSIDALPNSQTCYPGNTVSFTAGVSGSLPLSYQWSYLGTNIAAATNATLTLNDVQCDQAGDYLLTVTNAYGAATNAATLTVNAPLPAVPPPAGLISWWPADGNALDVVGGNNGTLVNHVTYENGNAGGQSFLNLGGNAGVDVGAAANLRLQDFTIEAWIQRSDATLSGFTGGPGMLFSFGSGGYGFGINDDGALLLAQVATDSVSSDSGDGDTGWHHVAVTKAGTNVVFYLDGSVCGNSNTVDQFTFTTSATIGAQTADPGFPLNSFNGAIDEMSVYNRALSAAEIQAVAGSSGGKTLALPQLQISLAGTNVVVAWPTWAGAFSLQSTADSLGSGGSWTSVSSDVQSQDEYLNTIIPIFTNRQFFRLVYPSP